MSKFNLKKNKIFTFGVIFIALAVLVCALLVVDNNVENKSEEKINVSLEIIAGDIQKNYEINTSRKYLGEALEDEGLISGNQGEYGLYITEADGIVADESSQEWWCITKEGENVMEGVSSIEIADGDKYELTLKKGYDLN